MSFATPEEYKAKYGTDVESGMLQAWLDDVSAYLRAEMGGRLDAHDDAQAASLRVVCLSATRRAPESAAPGFGVNQMSQSANGFSESYSFANPSGDVYLTKAERRMLGIGRMRIGSIRPDWSVLCDE